MREIVSKLSTIDRNKYVFDLYIEDLTFSTPASELNIL